MEKAALRSSAIFELGEKFEDKLEVKIANVNIAKGGVSAFSEASKTIEAISSHVDKDVDDENIDLDQAKLIKSWLTRCQYAMMSLSKQAENRVFIAEGQVSATREIIEATKKFYDVEHSKIPKVEDLEVEETLEAKKENEPVKKSGRRPSIKQQRQAKSAQEKSSKKKAT